MAQINFFQKDGRLHFSIPEMPELEAQIRKQINAHSVKIGKKEYYFRRGIQDIANAIQSGSLRKFGTPMVEVKDPFSLETRVMTCQEAYSLLHDIGGTYLIRQVSGSPLPPNYFQDREG